MRFRRNAPLDTGQVRDARGRSMGPGGVAVGGGGLGLVGLIIYILISVLSNGGGGAGLPPQLAPLADQRVSVNDTPSDIDMNCKTGQDANKRTDCRIVAVVNSVQEFWNGVFERSNRQYQYSDTVFFTGQTDTECGTADSQVGPFYCPRDKLVYIDLGFFDELQSRFGVGSSAFVQAYVIAHEYGHHVQDQLGALGGGSGGAGATGRSVRTELQADCLAGVWANHAAQTGYLTALTQADIADGLNAAAAVGDDRIQQETQGRVNPDSWTHGSAAQRQHWFTVGYRSGKPASCDTSGKI